MALRRKDITVENQNEIKIGSFRSIHFWLKSFVQEINKILHKFWSFCLSDSEQNEAKKNVMLKKAVFSVLNLPTTSFKWKCTDTLAELDNILQKVVTNYCSIKILHLLIDGQYRTKNIVKFCSISLISLISNIGFISVTDFELKFKILILVISNLNPNSKFLIFNITVTYFHPKSTLNFHCLPKVLEPFKVAKIDDHSLFNLKSPNGQ